MTRRNLAWSLSGHAVAFLRQDAYTVRSLGGTAAACKPLSTSALDGTLLPSTSVPSLPPSLRELQSTLRAPRASLITALDKQLASGRHTATDATTPASSAGGATAPAAVDTGADVDVLDADLCHHMLRANSVSRHSLDTLRLLRRFNGGLQDLRGQTILAKVLNVDARRVLVDTGFVGLSNVPRDDVSITHVYTEDGQLPAARLSTSDVRPGDLLRLRVDCVYTPYGDMQLSAVKGDVEQRRRTLWAELRRAMEEQRPVSGRLLNECPGGFAVGVAGFVAMLPAALAATATTRLVGVRQQFLILNMDNARRRITLQDPRLQRLFR